MYKADLVSQRRIPSHGHGPNEFPTDCYRDVPLAANTLESLLTWDVSGRAQRERERLNAIQRMPTDVQGGY